MVSLNRRTTSRPVARRRTVSLLAVLTAVLVPAALAWACNPQARLHLDRSAYTTGSQMQVSGVDFKEDVQLTLSLEPGGAVATVTTSSTGYFTARVPAPSSPGSYTLSAVGFEGDKVIDGLPARVSFSVTPASRPGSTPQTGTSRPGATAPTPGRFVEPEVPRARRFSAPSRRASGGRAPARSRTGGGTDRAAAVTTGAGVIKGSSGTVFAGSVARADRVASTSRGKSGAASDARRGKAARSSARSAVGEDVWSGFSDKAPGLLGSSFEAVPDGGAGSQLGWGLGLLALGLLALVSGFAGAEVRRRRASR